MTDVHRNYLRDLGFLFKEEALKAKVEAKAAAGSDGADFAAGRAMAWYEVMATMQNQARTFHLPLVDMALDGIEPDRDLV